jgi:hypothetical protein
VGAAAVDTCGAGDRLAGELAARLGDGRLVSEAVRDSVEAAAVFVASGGAGGLGPTAAGPDPAGVADTLPTWPEPAGGWAAADAVTRRVRAAGGTVVATGGVFEVGVTLLVPGGMATAFFDGRPDQYKPGPDARLADPAHIADAVLFALDRPTGVELREIVVAADTEPSWP